MQAMTHPEEQIHVCFRIINVEKMCMQATFRFWVEQQWFIRSKIYTMAEKNMYVVLINNV